MKQCRASLLLLVSAALLFGVSLAHAYDTWTRFDSGNGLPGNDLQALAMGPDGRIWVGTLANGAAAYGGGEWTVVQASPDGLSDNAVTSMGRAGSAVWFGHFAGGASRLDGDVWTHFSEADGLQDNWVSAFAVETTGNVWLGHRPFGTGGQGGGFSVYDGQSWQTSFQVGELDSNAIHDIAVDAKGAVWLAVGDQATTSGLRAGGVVRYEDGAWTTFTEASGLPASDVRAVVGAPGGAIWVGTGAGVACYDGSAWQVYDEHNGLASDDVLSLHVAANGDVWVGSRGGVSRLRSGAWQQYDVDDGLAGTEVRDIVVARNGSIWFATEAGLSRLTGDGAPAGTGQFYLPLFSQ